MFDQDEILIVFCPFDDITKAIGMKGDKQQKMSESEVLTVAWIAYRFFGSNYQATLSLLKATDQTLFPSILSKSRFLRRIHRWLDLLPSLLQILSEIKQKISLRTLYFIDSFPIPVCENIRISRSKLLNGEEYHGYIPSKRVYFYGLRVHIIADDEKFIHEFVIVGGRSHDLEGWVNASLSFLPKESRVLCDSAYTCYDWEDRMEKEMIFCNPRKKGSRRYEGELVESGKRAVRRLIETVGSVIRLYLGKRVQAVTARGLILKVMMAIISYDLHQLFSHRLKWQLVLSYCFFTCGNFFPLQGSKVVSKEIIVIFPFNLSRQKEDKLKKREKVIGKREANHL